MAIQDAIVGAASVAAGLLLWYWAIADSEVAQRLKLAKFVSGNYGRGGARVFYAILGTIFVILGVAIASGYSLELIG